MAEGRQVDRALVERAQDGDVEAFAALTAPRVARLHAAARWILHDDDAAADVVQDALLRAWVNLRALRDPDHFDGWLRRIVVNGCYAASRRRGRHGVVEIELTPEIEPGAAEDQRLVVVRDQLDRALQRLSTEQRTAVVLHHYLGLTQAEAAEAMGVPLGTVQSRLDRATRLMRAAIEADDRTPSLAPEGIR